MLIVEHLLRYGRYVLNLSKPVAPNLPILRQSFTLAPNAAPTGPSPRPGSASKASAASFSSTDFVGTSARDSDVTLSLTRKWHECFDSKFYNTEFQNFVAIHKLFIEFLYHQLCKQNRTNESLNDLITCRSLVFLFQSLQLFGMIEPLLF